MLPARFAVGTSMAVLPFTTTVAATGVPPAVRARVKLVLLSEELFIASEKVADIEEFSARPVAAFEGEVSDTVGGVVSEGALGGAVGPANRGTASSSPAAPPPQPDRPRIANTAA